MYKIYADNTLIYDSTVEDYKIGKGSITLETNKSGSFVFSLYPDHFYYDKFIRLKTVITVYKSDKIVFRGRILNDVTDYWNNKVITCEGELGFLQDSIIRPFNFTGTPEDLFKKFIEDHNSQVDEFKRFKIGTVTVIDPNNYIYRNNTNYESTINNLNERLINDSLGGYFYITHGEDDADPIPTLNYLVDFTRVSSQKIEFGSNLKNYTRTVKANEIATAIIPLGAEVDDGNDETENPKLTIASINDGRDYVYDEAGVALYGWIFKTMNWDDVTEASNLKTKAEEYLESVMKQNITIELNAIDLHLLNKNIESFRVCDYVQVISAPHNFNSTLLCNKQTLDLLKPENDSLILGYTYSTFTEINNKVSSSVSNIPVIRSEFKTVKNTVRKLDEVVSDTKKTVDEVVYGDMKVLAETVRENSERIEELEKNSGNNPDISDGVGIESVEQTTTSAEDNGVNIVTVTLTDGTSSTFQVLNGSKGSTGEKGDTGPQGPQGEKGDVGPEGPQGERGIQGLTGETGPVGPQGPQGDKGIQGDKGDKGDKGDAFTFSDFTADQLALLKGEKGDKGDTGPSGSNGITFTPKVSSDGNISWTNNGGLTNPTTVNIKGPKGDTGDQGIQGPKGDKGDKGDQGIQGETGPKGDTGPQGATGSQGPKGNDGVSCNHSWNGTTLTITSASGTSSANLKGDKGDKGDTGSQGIQGIQGPKGDTGLTGPTGPQGPQGEKGDTGATGATGSQGPKGDTGDRGPKGDTGATGANGVSPVISVSKVDGVTTITITDVDGTKTATIYDGKEVVPTEGEDIDGGTPYEPTTEDEIDGGTPDKD